LRSGLFGGTGWAQESLAFLDAAVQLLHVRGVPVHCPAGTQSRYQTLCVSLAAVSVAKAHHDIMHRLFLCLVQQQKNNSVQTNLETPTETMNN